MKLYFEHWNYGSVSVSAWDAKGSQHVHVNWLSILEQLASRCNLELHIAGNRCECIENITNGIILSIIDAVRVSSLNISCITMGTALASEWQLERMHRVNNWHEVILCANNDIAICSRPISAGHYLWFQRCTGYVTAYEKEHGYSGVSVAGAQGGDDQYELLAVGLKYADFNAYTEWIGGSVPTIGDVSTFLHLPEQGSDIRLSDCRSQSMGKHQTGVCFSTYGPEILSDPEGTLLYVEHNKKGNAYAVSHRVETEYQLTIHSEGMGCMDVLYGRSDN